jgi:hypothetical protein
MNEKSSGGSRKFKWLSFVLFITVLFFVFQILFALLASDDTIVGMAKSYAKTERDLGKHKYAYYSGKTDDEIDQYVNARKSGFIRGYHQESSKIIIPKAIGALILLIVAIGVYSEKAKPFRILALIVGILLLILIVVNLGSTTKAIKAYKYLESRFIVFVDMGWFIFLCLSTLACFVIFATLKGKKKEISEGTENLQAQPEQKKDADI